MNRFQEIRADIEKKALAEKERIVNLLLADPKKEVTFDICNTLGYTGKIAQLLRADGFIIRHIASVKHGGFYSYGCSVKN